MARTTAISRPTLIAATAPAARGVTLITGDSVRVLHDAKGLRDVVGGSNVTSQSCGGDYLCTALKGYDGPTGLGTPNGIASL